MITDGGIALFCLDTATNSSDRANDDAQVIRNSKNITNKNTVYYTRRQWVGTGQSTEIDVKIL
jgi:hypothetical protein